MANNKSVTGHFMNLAGETRNQIYSYVYEDVQDVDLPRDANNRNQVQNKLHLVNKLLAIECAAYIYRSLAVYVHHSAHLNKTLFRIMPMNLDYISRLRIHHTTYGESQWAQDRKFKIKHDNHWANTCAMIPKKMPALNHLVIDLTLNESPLRLNLTETWFICLFMLEPENASHPLRLPTSHIQINIDSFKFRWLNIYQAGIVGQACSLMSDAMSARIKGRNPTERLSDFLLQQEQQLPALFHSISFFWP